MVRPRESCQQPAWLDGGVLGEAVTWRRNTLEKDKKKLLGETLDGWALASLSWYVAQAMSLSYLSNNDTIFSLMLRLLYHLFNMSVRFIGEFEVKCTLRLQIKGLRTQDLVVEP